MLNFGKLIHFTQTVKTEYMNTKQETGRNVKETLIYAYGKSGLGFRLSNFIGGFNQS